MANNSVRRFPNSTHIANLKNRPDPQLEWRWAVVGDIPFADRLGLTNLITPAYFTQIEIPEYNFDNEQMHAGNVFYGYVNGYSLENMTAELYMDCKGIAEAWVTEWMRNIVDPVTGIYNLPINYKKVLYVVKLDNLARSSIMYKLEGCYPYQQSGNSLSASGEAMTKSVTFNIDRVTKTYDMVSPREKQSLAANFLSLINTVGKIFDV